MNTNVTSAARASRYPHTGRKPRSNPWRWVLALGVCLGFAIGQARAAPAYHPGRILIRPKDRVPAVALARLQAALGGRVRRAFSRLGGLQVLSLPPFIDVARALAFYRRSGLVAYAEPDYLVHPTLEPNDFRYHDGSLWGLHNVGFYGGTAGADIHAPQAWSLQCEAPNIIVAVIDTGVRCTHEDLAGNMWTNPGETGVDALGVSKTTNLRDDDGDGYVDDVHGINAILGSGDPSDDYGHGTHVAGIIGGMGNNSVGVVGVAWRVQIMACKFLDAQGNGYISDAITCLDYARTHGAKIVNASWGAYGFTSSALRDAINSLRDAGVIIVTAAGNNANDNDANSLYPASYEYDNNLAVAATDRTDALAPFSNYGGYTVHLGAPGSPIFSCWNGSDQDYCYHDGTSMAAPFVAGACALLEAHYPNETHHQIIRRILDTVDPLPTLAGRTVSGGRLNLAAALQPLPPPTIPPVAVWVDDDVPAGAVTGADGGDAWTWVSVAPTPCAGVRAHQSNAATGIHEHFFTGAGDPLEIFPGDTLFTYVYLDAANPPREIMLSWNDGCWEHRAYWGENTIPYGLDGTSNRVAMGALPTTGQWVRLEVSAHALGLEGAKLKGMSFTLLDGGATWDASGRQAAR